jgi:hypothetical protein
MAYAHLQELKRLRDTAGTVPVELFRSRYLDGAIFAVSEDECYFVVEAEDQYHAVIGAFSVDDEGRLTFFMVNQIESFMWRDQAILCALNFAINDSGGAESIRERVIACAPYVTPWQTYA